jgi:hypothetical protein
VTFSATAPAQRSMSSQLGRRHRGRSTIAR